MNSYVKKIIYLAFLVINVFVKRKKNLLCLFSFTVQTPINSSKLVETALNDYF